MPAFALIALLAGCASQVPLRASSLYVLRQEDSRVTLQASEPEVVAVLTDLMREHGFFRTASYDVHKGVTYYVFRGEQRRAGKSKLPAVDGHELGSWFLARLESHEATTDLLLIGKPTLDDVEVCAESDGLFAESRYACVDKTVRSDYPPERLPTGREEAAIVRAVLAALRAHYHPE